jgi:hypothetical protein
LKNSSKGVCTSVPLQAAGTHRQTLCKRCCLELWCNMAGIATLQLATETVVAMHLVGLGMCAWSSKPFTSVNVIANLVGITSLRTDTCRRHNFFRALQSEIKSS